MKQKIVIVGGSSGIGFHLAERLVEIGNDVIVASRSMEKLAEVKAKLRNVTIEQVDANNESDVIAFSSRIGKIDHLVSTIRGRNVLGNFANSNTADVKAAFDEKFWSQYNMAHYCLKNISSKGSIILTSGIAAQRSYPNSFWQAAANGAVETLVKSLAKEVSPVRINAVSPGFVERRPGDVERLAMVKNIENNLPLKRLATADELVDAYLFLMNNSYTTGTVLLVDGGILTA